MTSYKFINQNNGGAIIRILNPNLREYNNVYVTNSANTKLFDESFSNTTSNLELKIPLDDLVNGYTSAATIYKVNILIANASSSVLSKPDFSLSDIPKGGDGTWHYYTITIS